METEFKKIRNYLMIDIGRGDQENFEKKNCGQSPQKIRNKSAKSGFTGWKCTKITNFTQKRALFLARIIILCYGPILSKIGPSFGPFLVVTS